MVQIEDLIYWTISALLLFFIMLKENHGEIRGFLILGSFIGMILYFSAVSKIFLKISDKILSLIKKILIVTFKILFTPIGYVLKLFKKIFDLTIGNIIFNKIKFNKLKFKKKTRK
jgi:spore cortex biosynthesis protein YabQ